MKYSELTEVMHPNDKIVVWGNAKCYHRGYARDWFNHKDYKIKKIGVTNNTYLYIEIEDEA